MAVRIARAFHGYPLRDPGRLCIRHRNQHSLGCRRRLLAASPEYDLSDPAGIAVDAEGRHCATACPVDWIWDAAEDRRRIPRLLLPDHRRERERSPFVAGFAAGPGP